MTSTNYRKYPLPSLALGALLAMSTSIAMGQTASSSVFEFRIPLRGLVVQGVQGLQPPPFDEDASPGHEPPPEYSLTLSLAPHALPAAIRGVPYEATDFKTLLALSGVEVPPLSAISWSVTGGALPSGLALGSGGVLSGTPTQRGTSNFDITARYENDFSAQTYTIVVSGQPLDVVAVATGLYHSCAITVAGAAKCWGNNGNGQLGNNTKTDSLAPVPVIGMSSGVVAITAGSAHTCALKDDGRMWCWGSNGNGRLGVGDTTGRNAPTLVSLENVRSISAGTLHTCATTTDNKGYCWGYSGEGQLGIGSTSQALLPTLVGAPLNATALSIVAGTHTCGITVTGGLYCWGPNTYGQLGDNTKTTRTSPVPVSSLSGNNAVRAVGLGTQSGTHTCAITTDSAVACWGRNESGQLGGSGEKLIPALVSGLSNVSALALGQSHTCAIHAGGAVACWGSDSVGQLGDNASSGNKNTPTPVAGISSGAMGIDADYTHTCVTLATGGAKCWGQNSYGKLGDGTITNRFTPVQVAF